MADLTPKVNKSLTRLPPSPIRGRAPASQYSSNAPVTLPAPPQAKSHKSLCASAAGQALFFQTDSLAGLKALGKSLWPNTVGTLMLPLIGPGQSLCLCLPNPSLQWERKLQRNPKFLGTQTKLSEWSCSGTRSLGLRGICLPTPSPVLGVPFSAPTFAKVLSLPSTRSACLSPSGTAGWLVLSHL